MGKKIFIQDDWEAGRLLSAGWGIGTTQ